jgi:hypothetical protein
VNKKKEYTKLEILAKLKWFHGEEFDKYPLEDELQKLHQMKN